MVYAQEPLADFDLNTQFLAQLAPQTIFKGLARVALAAGELPQAGEVGARRALGELLSCPICSGTWIAAALVYGLGIVPGPTRAFLAIMSAIGVAELLNAATEALQWTGEAERKQAGSND